MSDLIKGMKDDISELILDFENVFKVYKKRRLAAELEVNKYLETGILPNFANCDKLESLKENADPNTCNNSQTQAECVPARPVKTEKTSISSVDSKPLDGTFAVPQLPVKGKKIKKEPAPAKSNRVTRSKRTQRAPTPDEDPTRESDVQLQAPHISLIEILDSDSENEEEKPKASTRSKRATNKSTKPSTKTKTEIKKEVPAETRSTRTKTKQQAMKRLRNEDESGDVTNENKRSRSHSKGKKSNGNTSTQTVYQDALSSLDHEPEPKSAPNAQADINNATFAITDKKALNATYNLEAGPSKVKLKANQNDFFTDDESDKEVEPKSHTPPRSTANQGKGPVFSPYSHTPMKDKVKAFEQLAQPSTSSIPVKYRTGTPDGGKKPSKHITPITSKQLTKMASLKTTPSSKGFSTGKQSSSSALSAKSTSAMKSSQAEYLRRKEREQEAIKKREALLLAQTEEKRKKREERQLKAQQQREAQEKEKLRQIELQKQKEERYEQVIAEKERQFRKNAEENAHKRMLVKKKATDERPKYKIYKTPLLPVPDCYDSDDERYESSQKNLPDWLDSKVLNPMLRDQICIGEKLKNTFFSCAAQTANLEELFGTLDPRKLTRTSSAIWSTPPRYTQMHSIHGALEEDDDE